jgi:hypothetical protein
MRQKVTSSRLREFIQQLARRAKGPGNVYFTGGSTALLLGIRDQTVDIDLKLDPEPAGIFEAIATLKNELDLNIELASPADFIPKHDNWRDNSIFIEAVSGVAFYHYDLVAQALAKIERGFEQDIADVKALIDKGFISAESITQQFKDIEEELVRFPAIDVLQFREKIKSLLSSLS